MTDDVYAKIYETLQLYGAQLITLGGRIHPYVGGAVGVLLLFGLIWLGWKVKKRAWEHEKDQSGSNVGGEVGQDQNTTKPVLDQGDDFFGDKPKP